MALKMRSPAVRPTAARRPAVVVRAQQQWSVQNAGQKLAAATLAAGMAFGGMVAAPAIANEFDVLDTPRPTKDYFIDDASVLSKSSRGELNKKLAGLDIETGYRLEVVTIRKLEFETDAFAFADKVIEGWYPTAEEGDKQGVLLVVTSGKEGALVGGKSFMNAVGDDLIDSILSDNIPIYTEEEKYNASVLSSVDRIAAQLTGQPVPDAPSRNDTERKRTYKTKEETEKSKNITGTVVGSLLLIAVVVPMLQYYGYTAKD